MNRFTPLVGSAVVLVALWVFGHQTPASAAANATSVCGTLATSTTWTLANSPYEICFNGATIGPTATLTIQPGVVVQFQSGINAGLLVQGELNAIGMPTQPITFTGVVTTPGSWSGLLADNTVITPALVNLSYVTLEDGGAGSPHGQLYVARGIVTVTNSLIRNGSSNGIYFTYQTIGFNIQSSNFVSNSLSAIVMEQPTMDLAFSDLSASRNGTNGVYITNVSTHVAGQRHWNNPGIPYVINDGIYNQPGDALTIDPGTELQFTSSAGLGIGGQLKAIGLPDQPITFTAQTPLPGSWRGLVIDGGNTTAIAQLDYATVEYGGFSNHANIVIGSGGAGQLIARHTTIRASSEHGLLFNAHGTGSILNSQIISNSQVITTAYGIFINGSGSAASVLATNDWWGDPNGPKPDLVACGGGHGDKVSTGVLFQPVLTNTNFSAEFPLSAAPQLTLTPRRWFAPADGVSKIYFDITLRDGNGKPLPGRTVLLHTNLGSVVDGGLTDLNGHTLADLTSNTTGDATVYATLNPLTSCEGALSPVSKVTFTTSLDVVDLFPNSPAPYFAGDLSLTPLPVVTGITETIHAKLTNPLTVPITVDVEFAFAQASVGLTFGPIKDITQTIPASSTISLSADFLPLISGHYCVQVSYAITAIGSAQLSRPQAGRQLKQFNFNPEQGPTLPPSSKDSLNKADKSLNKVEKLSPTGTNIQIGIFDRWWKWAKDTAEKIDKSLGGDPPRQDYNVSTLPIWYRWPHTQPDANITPARAAALNAASDALADVNAYGTAAATALDRYGGASAAGDLGWAAQQANAQIFYEQQMGSALLTYADKLDAFVQVLNNEHETNITITVSDVISYQQSLSTTGFSTQEISDAKLIGLTDADIEALRQDIITSDPNDLAGNILDMYSNEAFVSRNLGNALLHPTAFVPSISVSGGAGLQMAATVSVSNTLAQVQNTSATIQVGNPLSTTANINLLARRIDLPADWAVSVSPAQVTLAPDQQITVTVNILTGSPVLQGSQPRVAIEGYANNQLLGGVVVDVIVPNYMPYFLHTYLPVIRK